MPGTTNDEQFCTIREVAEEMNVSQKTIRRAIDRGDLKVHRFGAKGRIIRISAEDRRAYLALRRR
jgi:excisionase family DNA binding protein